ncbi:MAG: hypothetical protein SGJ19_20230 [Planctomycetia bacterium]|nr:hypothetical protein [Planctomycetia bacterium]
MNAPASSTRFSSIRPLVRYVDEEQAVVEVMVNLQQPLPLAALARRRFGAVSRLPRDVQVRVDVDTEDGFHDEEAIHLMPRSDNGSVKVRIVEPRRWWPAGMGDQPLYKLSVNLMVDDEPADRWTGTFGLTSVRHWRLPGDTALSVNGQACNIGAVVPVDLVHERHLLPVTGDSLMIVRGHWGSDLLYEAADRAGILLIQCVPLDAEGRPEEAIIEQVNRLSRHPSLAGWFVGHLGRFTERMAFLIECLDPTRPVFKEIPEVRDPAAA